MGAELLLPTCVVVAILIAARILTAVPLTGPTRQVICEQRESAKSQAGV